MDTTEISTPSDASQFVCDYRQVSSKLPQEQSLTFNSAAGCKTLYAPISCNNQKVYLPSMTKDISQPETRSHRGSVNSIGAATTPNMPIGVANQSAFINKLYSLLEEADKRLICWNECGTFFIVKNTTGNARNPRIFKFASFVRQLNMYGFHKINDSFYRANSANEVWEFKHSDFRRGEFDLLKNIKRKAPKSSGHVKSGNASGRDSISIQPQMSPHPNVVPLSTDKIFSGRDCKVEELTNRVIEMEDKLATLAESYGMVCSQSLACRRELSSYHGIVSNIVSIMSMICKEEGNSAIGVEIEKEIGKLAESITEDSEVFAQNDGICEGVNDSLGFEELPTTNEVKFSGKKRAQDISPLTPPSVNASEYVKKRK